MPAIGFVDWKVVNATDKLIEVNEVSFESVASEVPVAVSAGRALCQDEIES